LEEKYVKTGKLRFVFRDFPVPGHTSAVRAAHAAHCAADQDKFWPMHDHLFANVDQLGGSHDEDFEVFRRFASELGLDEDAFMACMESRKYLDRIAADVESGRALGISGTPAYVLNGEVLIGLYPTDVWARMIDKRLAELR